MDPDAQASTPPHREQLLHLLCEAAELEHGLMCSYLFAAFSLRRSGLGVREQAAVDRWRASIREVAVQEMLHLALVQNLLAALGGAPHLQRPNFPVSPGFYPSGLVLQLRRFDADTIEHFVFLEQPEGGTLEDSAAFEPERDYARATRVTGLTASAQEYGSVSALYHAIERGFVHLTERLGEEALFLGDPRVQVGRDLLDLEGLHPVTDLASARRAIACIVEQGEGSRSSHETSHYERFRAIQTEHASLVAAGAFDPAQPVAADPVWNRPVDPAIAHVTHPETAGVLDVANAAYGLMVQLLARVFGAADPAPVRSALAGAAIGLMGAAIAPLGELLTTLPVGPSRRDEHAGLSFTLPRSTHVLPQPRAAWLLLCERADEIAAGCGSLDGPPVLARVGGAIARIAAELRAAVDAAFAEPREGGG